MLPIVLGFVIIFADVFPVLPAHAEHFSNSQAQAVAVSDHAVPSGEEVQDHQIHPVCNPGMGCFACTVPAEEVAATTFQHSVVIGLTDTAQLVTRTVAPPLPPPKIISLV